ncbi:MAG: glutamate--tRNA ligase [Nitrospinota bacterium]|nr:glutamate--tRNA ligase [Nitrospinota bacterium]
MSDQTQIRTRFAPSPTGYLHIGGARTAVFSWLYAKRYGGKFILRVEDTDNERSTEDSIQQILDAMAWLGLDYDEGPFRQTDRWEIYHSFIKKLLDSGHAYRCVCTREDLDEKRELMQKSGAKPMYDGSCRGKDIPADVGKPYVVRIAGPKDGKTEVEDLLRGTVVFDNSELDDMIIMRTDGSPTYNFCVVVDDADMKISHVIRGDDHLANTPRQLVIYKALGLKPPKFAHVSMILGSDGKRLSKRHGALSVLEYRDMGILPDAFLNYLTRLGWSHGDQEVFTLDELKSKFDLDAVSKSASRFDLEKMTWTNAEHLRKMDNKALVKISGNAFEGIPGERLETLLEMLKPRARTLVDLAASARIYLEDGLEYDEKSVTRFLTSDTASLLSELADRLEIANFGRKEDIETVFNEYLEEKGLKLKILAQPVRVALTGGTVSPGLFDIMAFMGKDKCLARIREGARRGRG